MWGPTGADTVPARLSQRTNPMRTRRRATTQDLHRAIDCLPTATKIAMLEGIRSNEIIVGAYTDGRGVCPMLAAHRAGGRTSCISFAKAWDRFALRDARKKCARRASERELLVLRTHLEASLLEEDRPDLAAAIGEHRELLARQCLTDKSQRTPCPGDRERTFELQSRPGWSWMRLVRRLDDYERVLDRLTEQREAEPVA